MSLTHDEEKIVEDELLPAMSSARYTTAADSSLKLRAITAVCCASFLYFAAVSLSLVKLQNLVLTMLGTGNVSQASLYFGLIDGTFSLCQFLFSPLTGVLSDKYGRKIPLIICLVGFAANQLLVAVANHIAMLFAATVIGGVTGGTQILLHAIVSDVTEIDERPRYFVYYGAALAAGVIAGPALGFAMQSLDVHIVFVVSTAIALLAATVVLFLFSESHPTKLRIRTIHWIDAQPLGALKFFFEASPLLLLLVPVLFTILFTVSGFTATFSYFARYRFNWDDREIYATLIFVAVSSVLVLLVSSAVVFQRLSDRIVLVIGLVCSFATDACLAFAYDWWLVIPMGAFKAVSTLAYVCIMSVLSALVSPLQQGQLFGAASVVDTFGQTSGKYVFSALFSYATAQTTQHKFGGAPFVLSGLITVVATVWAILAFRRFPEKPGLHFPPANSGAPVDSPDGYLYLPADVADDDTEAAVNNEPNEAIGESSTAPPHPYANSYRAPQQHHTGSQ